MTSRRSRDRGAALMGAALIGPAALCSGYSLLTWFVSGSMVMPEAALAGTLPWLPYLGFKLWSLRQPWRFGQRLPAPPESAHDITMDSITSANMSFDGFTMAVLSSNRDMKNEPSLRDFIPWIHDQTGIGIDQRALFKRLHRILMMGRAEIVIEVDWWELLRGLRGRRINSIIVLLLHLTLNPTGDGCTCWKRGTE